MPTEGKVAAVDPDRTPRGWYQIGWSSDFESGRSLPLHYFDQDLVAFRGASGAMHVFDAFCPHMGAHLGYGGAVEGDCLRCPYHGWLFDEKGINAEIPYGNVARTEVGVRSWDVREIDGLVLIYYDADGGPPVVDLPRTFSRTDGAVWPIDV